MCRRHHVPPNHHRKHRVPKSKKATKSPRERVYVPMAIRHICIFVASCSHSLPSQNPACPLLLMFTSSGRQMLLIARVICHHNVDCFGKEFQHSCKLFATTFTIKRTHSSRNVFALFHCDWCESLRPEEVYTRLFLTQVRLESNQHKWRVRAEVEDLRIPLNDCQRDGFRRR